MKYRAYRGLPLSPTPEDKESILGENGRAGGLTSRQIARLVQELSDFTYENVRSDDVSDDAKMLRAVSTQWLIQTGVCQDIAHRPLKHMSDDLGYASMGTTDRVYIQSDMKERAATGKTRKV